MKRSHSMRAQKRRLERTRRKERLDAVRLDAAVAVMTKAAEFIIRRELTHLSDKVSPEELDDILSMWCKLGRIAAMGAFVALGESAKLPTLIDEAWAVSAWDAAVEKAMLGKHVKGYIWDFLGERVLLGLDEGMITALWLEEEDGG